MRSHLLRAAASLPLVLAAGCPSNPDNPAPFNFDVQPIDQGPDAAHGASFCALPLPALPGASVPGGLCIRLFANVGTPRVMAIADNGDVFVAAPQMSTAGGAGGGPGAILVLADDDHDGTAEVATFAAGIPDVHGLAIGGGFVWFTTANNVVRTPYATGQRVETAGARQIVATFDTLPAGRWTHGMAVTPSGTAYATQGVYSDSTCPDSPRAGTIQRVDTGALTTMAQGFRNPMYARCRHDDETCAATELGDDGGSTFGAHEKVLMLAPGGQYGFPCCTTQGHSTPMDDGHFDCASVTLEQATFPLNDTPFGLDWERGVWPSPFTNGLFVALHGSFYSNPQWQGSRVVFAPTDPVTHAPTGPFRDVVRGFAYAHAGGAPMERATDVAFAPDGRLFVADDQANAIYWVAPEALEMR